MQVDFLLRYRRAAKGKVFLDQISIFLPFTNHGHYDQLLEGKTGTSAEDIPK